CRDGTRGAAERAATAHPDLRLLLLEGPGAGSGPARRAGMDLACARLLALGRPDGLVACTDADSRTAPDWLALQVAGVAEGARAIGGRTDVADEELAALGQGVAGARERAAAARLAAVRAAGDGPEPEHHQFSGASMAVTAATYAEVGGLEPLPALEDEGFERLLRRHRVPIHRPSAVRVETSGRPGGRARHGLGRDLALASWLEGRTYRGADFPLERVLAAKGSRTVSAILPAREVAATIGPILDALAPLREAGVLDEVLVVDAGSGDGTAAIAAARGVDVADEDELLADHGPARGKGDAMWRGLSATAGDVVCFLDTDTEDFTAAFALGLLGPLLADDSLALVKGAFRRPFRAGATVQPEGGGRVTELVARPLLNLHAPELAGFEQPLAGEIAARRDLLEALPFPVGYGVEIAMLLDAAARVGVGALGQVQLGSRQNRHQSLRELSGMAYAVLAAAARRVAGAEPVPGPLVLPHGGELVVRPVPVEERPPLVTVPTSVRRGG
ncbi:MAG TPA: glucosyl-3-phosphoglycerate synthase, partial [Solirubrobacteraceae bacterium]